MSFSQNIRIAVDGVVFAYANSSLYVLLIQQKFGTNTLHWALPGGLVKANEPLIDAVKREIKEETNVTVNYIEQLYTFGDDIYRDSRNRVISVAYFALVNPSHLKLMANTDADAVAWFKIDEVPKLAFDHNKILDKARKRLQAKLTYQPIGFDLLPKEFLFSELEHLYTSIIGKEIDRRNFRKKILSLGFIEETEHIHHSKSGRPAKFFKFNIAKYKELTNEGMVFEIKFA
ncbi:NUDIX hydrolase [Flavobacterium oreochromis]|uniref:NUDIX hydrolase n=1 Tax=Flavobacterium columnare TaxID=996 RepID=A0A246GCP7_9FLAO|nr:NUDIX domain-containing protein [Flavobacterium oreochromis]OWP78758.1 NUDIX hydrolase [Flavobacterium oreochromis]OWP78915.1 NUDIX hydrolase [Flavobacterium oreochromis]POR29461.1 NUDIX hydrolase [Flavobacterium columnare]